VIISRLQPEATVWCKLHQLHRRRRTIQ